MTNLARKLETGAEILGTRGVVARKEGAAFVVQSGDAEIAARRAVSCLVEPVVGDVVLLGSGAEDAWLIAVLDREVGQSVELSVTGDMRLRAAHGKVAVVAQEGIDLITAGTTKVVSNEIEVRTAAAHVVADGVELASGWLRAEIGKVKLVAQSLDQVLDRFSQRVRRSYRRVEDVEQLHAGAVHHRIDKTLRMHAQDTALTADGLVKVDGKQIHVG